MPSFSLTVKAPNPTPGPQFPVGTQFQGDAENIGPTTPAFVNVIGAEASYDAETDTVTYDITGDGGGGEPGPETPLQIQQDNVNVGANDTETLDFTGAVTVTDVGSGKRRVTVSPTAASPLTVSEDGTEIATDVTLINVVGDSVAITPAGPGAVDIALRSGVRVYEVLGDQTVLSVSGNAWQNLMMFTSLSGFVSTVTEWGNAPSTAWPPYHEDFHWFEITGYPSLYSAAISGRWLGGAGSLEPTMFRLFNSNTPWDWADTEIGTPIGQYSHLWEGERFNIGFSGVADTWGNGEGALLQVLNNSSGNTIVVERVRVTIVPFAFSPPQGS